MMPDNEFPVSRGCAICDRLAPRKAIPPIQTDEFKVEKELYDAWIQAIDNHRRNTSIETWQRRIAAHAAWEAVYNWNRSE